MTSSLNKKFSLNQVQPTVLFRATSPWTALDHIKLWITYHSFKAYSSPDFMLQPLISTLLLKWMLCKQQNNMAQWDKAGFYWHCPIDQMVSQGGSGSRMGSQSQGINSQCNYMFCNFHICSHLLGANTSLMFPRAAKSIYSNIRLRTKLKSTGPKIPIKISM